MSIQSVESLALNGTMSFDLAEKYLNIYIGEADWKKRLGSCGLSKRKK